MWSGLVSVSFAQLFIWFCSFAVISVLPSGKTDGSAVSGSWCFFFMNFFSFDFLLALERCVKVSRSKLLAWQRTVVRSQCSIFAGGCIGETCN